MCSPRPARMAVPLLLWAVLACFQPLASPAVNAAEPSLVFQIWPEGKMPGETNIQGEEVLDTARRRTFALLTNVANPTLTVYLPPPEKRTGAAVMALPGGGLRQLAYVHEGVEIADWLCAQGITVFMLKYRVPAPEAIGLMDAQRAMGLIRHRAEEFQIDPNRVGIMGFSAGGQISVLLATRHAERTYEKVDAADDFSCKPSTVALIYSGGLAGRGGVVREAHIPNLTPENVPPIFLCHAFPDSAGQSLAFGLALKQNNIPCEVHIYEEGVHGFGPRESPLPVGGWTARYTEWLARHGFFNKPYVSKYADQLAAAMDTKGMMPKITQLDPQATLADAYAAQGEYVKRKLQDDRRAGFKASTATAPDGSKRPVVGVLFESGRIASDQPVAVELAPNEEVVVEVELGFVISQGLQVPYRLKTLEQTMGAVDTLVAVVELPANARVKMEPGYNSTDIVAANIGSGRFIVGQNRISLNDINPNEIKVSLTRDGQPPLTGDAGAVEGGQWEHLRLLINEIIDQGYSLNSRDMIIAGSLAVAVPAPDGHYVADFGPLGKIEFDLKSERR